MSEHIWRIYRYYNPVEDKSYIGQTTKNVNERAHNGVGYRKGTKIREAFDKYGFDTFEQSILRLCTTQEDADYWEKFFIKKFDSIENGYNSQEGGQGFTGFLDKHHSEETKRKMAEKHSGESNHMYGMKGEKSPNYGIHWSEETRNKLSKANKGKKLSEEHKKNLSKAIEGTTWYNNGVINIHININTTKVPDGFVRGMLPKRRNK